MNNQVFLALMVRISIAVFTRTFFQPDEYFQALEPAHALVFGYGHVTWEWLTDRPIRSIIYPSLNVPLFWLVKLLHLDDAALGDLLLVCTCISPSAQAEVCADHRTSAASWMHRSSHRYLGLAAS